MSQSSWVDILRAHIERSWLERVEAASNDINPTFDVGPGDYIDLRLQYQGAVGQEIALAIYNEIRDPQEEAEAIYAELLRLTKDPQRVH